MPHADPEARRAYNAAYHQRRRSEVLAKRREQYASEPEKVLERNRQWRAANPEKGAEYARQYRRDNPDLDRQRRLDPQIRIANAWHAKVTRAVAGLSTRKRLPANWRADSALAKVLGCSPRELRAHIEAQFLPGMSWDNRGLDGWEIDLIRPISSFDLTDPDQVGLCFHYTNVQPLWRADNQRKYNRSV
jgi:hypothetical protein